MAAKIEQGENENPQIAKEEMEVDDAADSDDESSEDSDDDEMDVKNKGEITALEAQIVENPYSYDPYVTLIQFLRKDGELDKLREVRERMSSVFPLSEALWLEWLKDEISVAQTEEDREKITLLFERAVKDYLNVKVWCEYVQFAIGDMGKPNGVEKVRNVFERALTAAGLHVLEGAVLWETYREFENAVLAGLQPIPGSVSSPEQMQKIKTQTKCITKLFRRQLSIPLMGMESTLAEYKEWCIDGDLDQNIQKAYNDAKQRLSLLMVKEDALLVSEEKKLEDYERYITSELDTHEPARIQCMYERAIQDHCLVPSLWAKYTKYLDHELRVPDIALSVHERAVRNCPWAVDLWLNYLRALERNHQSHDKVKELLDRMLASGFTQGSEYLRAWTAYCDYLRRRITKWDTADDDTGQVAELRNTFEKAINHLLEYYPDDGDVNCTLHQYWARIEAKFCKNMEKTRELWNQIMQKGFGNQAQMWLEYFALERAYGDHRHCRKLLQRAINSVTDWPESVCDMYISFESHEGTLDDYDQAVIRCEAQLKRLEERRLQNAEKEAAFHGKRGGGDANRLRNASKGGGHKPHVKGGGREKKDHKSQQQQKQQQPPQQHPPKEPESPVSDTASSPDKQQRKRPHKDSSPEGSPIKMDNEGFKVPPPPVPRAPSPVASTSQTKPSSSPRLSPPPGLKSAPPPGFKAPLPKSAPPPGFKPKTPGVEATDTGPPEKRLRVDDKDEKDVSGDKSKDVDKDERTVFVSNLAYYVTEEQLHEIFSKIGELEEIRLIVASRGKSKGFAYVEYKDKSSVPTALKLDREKIDERPMFVSPCEDKSNKGSAAFKYSTELEKNKLFVKGLPFTMTKEALATLFSQYGKLKDVRLVTYRSGTSKGLAYVDYVNESDASQAVMKADGLQVGEHTISVALSNPPGRRTPLSQREQTSTFQPALGGGKRDTGERGRARTQLSFQPRALQSKTKPAPASSKSSSSVKDSIKNDTPAPNGKEESAQSTEDTKKLSNDDFRKMLLGK